MHGQFELEVSELVLVVEKLVLSFSDSDNFL